MRSRASRFAFVVGLAVATGACVSLPSTTAPTVRLFTFPPIASEPSTAGRSAGRLRVEDPTIASPYRGTLIAIRDAPQSTEIRYSREARFAASLSSLLGERLADLATDRGRFDNVLHPGRGGAVDWRLIGRIEVFECRLVATSFEAWVTMTVELERARGAERVFMRRYEQAAPFSGSDAASIVESLARAFDQIVRRAIDDAANAAESAPAAGKSF